MAIRISPDIAGIVPYSPGKPIEEVERELGITGSIKLASNENPRGPSPKALAVLSEAAKTVNRYPDGGGYYLRDALAELWKVAPWLSRPARNFCSDAAAALWSSVAIRIAYDVSCVFFTST